MERPYRYVVQMAAAGLPPSYRDYLPQEFFRALCKRLPTGEAGIFWCFRDNIAYIEYSESLDEALRSLYVWAMDAHTGRLIR